MTDQQMRNGEILETLAALAFMLIAALWHDVASAVVVLALVLNGWRRSYVQISRSTDMNLKDTLAALEIIANTQLPFWTIADQKYVKLEHAVAMRQIAKDALKEKP